MYDCDSSRTPITSTSAQYPTNSDGGVTGTKSSSMFASGGKGRTIFDGLVISANAAGGTVSLMKGDGTTVVQVIVIPTGMGGTIDLFGLSFVPSTDAGWSALVSVGTLTVGVLWHTAQ